MKSKRLILHIGTPKSGSTSIQQSLGKAHDALKTYNIYYPIIEPSSISPYNHIFTFIPIFVDTIEDIFWFRRRLQPFEDKDLNVQNYRQAWIKEFNTFEQDHFIISAEHLVEPYFNEDAVIRIKEFVGPYFDNVTIIAYVRHYDTWIPSRIQEYIKNGLDSVQKEELREIVEEFLNCPPYMSYQQSLQKWIHVFGRENIVVRPFDPDVFHEGSLLSDFFHASGLPVDDIEIPEIRSNESIGKYAVSFVQHYNQKYPVFVDGSLNKERGLSREGLPVNVYKNNMDERFNPKLIYSLGQAKRFNEEIDFVNQFFTDGYQFQHVSPGTGKMNLPGVDDIPIEFFVELANNYNKRYEFFRNRNGALQRQNEAFREQNKTLQDQNTYYQRIMDITGLALFLRVLHRLPFLRAILHKITQYEHHKKKLDD